MQAIRVASANGMSFIEDIALPFAAPGSTSRMGEPIPMERFWLTRTPAGTVSTAPSAYAHLVVILGGELTFSADGMERTLGPGDLALLDDTKGQGHAETSTDDVWKLLVTTPGWQPSAGMTALPDAPPRPRRGRPLMSWMYDDGGSARTETFRWPVPMLPVPPVEAWPKSDGGSLTRSVQPDGEFAQGSWHQGPRRQLAITLTGGGENETGDGTKTQPHAGDFVFVDDITGQGHISRGKGDRRILFVTVADDSLLLEREV